MQMHEVDLFDSLRPWLKHEKAFYEHEDSETAPIRMGTRGSAVLGAVSANAAAVCAKIWHVADMLKGLARKWKLHTQPGFWQTHQTRLSLALALRNFIKAKKLQLGEPVLLEELDKDDGTDADNDQHGDSGEIDMEALERFRKILPKHRTDVFRSHRDCTEAIIYLSRHSQDDVKAMQNPTKSVLLCAPCLP